MTTIETTTATAMDGDALAALLAQAAPSAGVLGELECERLSAAGCLDAVIAWERLVRYSHAGLIRSLAALGRAEDRWGLGLAESEVCAALAWAPSTAQYRLAEAEALTRLFPDTLQQLGEGRVSLEQARSLAQLTMGLGDGVARAVQERVLPRMAGQSTAVTRQAIRRAVLRADPDAAAKRHQCERTRRRVELFPEADGMATLSFFLPADVAQMAWRTLTTLAHNAKRREKNTLDTRTLDQRRADLLPTLLHHHTPGTTPTSDPHTSTHPDATTPSPIPARINVVVGLDTLLGLSPEPAHLDGYGPITPQHAHTIAHNPAARWRFLLTTPNGTLIDTSPRTYTPTAAIKRLTELQHTTCVFPHCHMPANRCDLDHNQPYGQGGPTTVDNLAPLCRRHHNHKTHGAWQLNRTDDTIEWTSTHTGHTYTTTPTRYQPTPTPN